MIVEYLRYTIPQNRQTDFIKHYKEATTPLLESPYCQAFELCQCSEDSSQFIIRIEWTSADDHLKKFRTSAEFKKFLSYISPYIKDIDEMRHYEQLSTAP